MSVKEEREKLGWSQAELAEAAGLKKETIAKIESGEWNPRLATREKLERALKRSTEGTYVTLQPGKTYRHKDRTFWLCLAADIEHSALVERGDGWTCSIHGIRQSVDETISWDYSSSGFFKKAPAK